MAINKQQEPLKQPQPGSRMQSQRPTPKWKPAQEALRDIEETFGLMPAFVSVLTEQALPGAWNEAKNLYFNPKTALDPKLKSLMGLSVGTQIPCDMLCHFNKLASELFGATEQEQSEAILMASMTRHWSTVLNGNMIDREAFKKETSQVISYVQKMMKDSGGKAPPEEVFLTNFSTSAETYKDIEKTLGLVPKFFLSFPEIAISAAWSEFKALHINPYTAISGKNKELIGLAVSSQIPCDYCIYFHQAMAKLNGATDVEIQEAVALAALGRQWSSIFHGSHITQEKFEQNADAMIQNMSHRLSPQ